MREHCRWLDIGVEISGPHDFTVRFRPRSSCAACCVHRIPRPTSVTTAIRPSYRCGMALASTDDLPDGQSEIFFLRGLDSRLGLDRICEIRFLAKCFFGYFGRE